MCQISRMFELPPPTQPRGMQPNNQAIRSARMQHWLGNPVLAGTVDIQICVAKKTDNFEIAARPRTDWTSRFYFRQSIHSCPCPGNSERISSFLNFSPPMVPRRSCFQQWTCRCLSPGTCGCRQSVRFMHHTCSSVALLFSVSSLTWSS